MLHITYTNCKCGPSPIIKVMCFDVARLLCHKKGYGQCFREAPMVSKVTCIIFARHPYRKGDAQQRRVTFVRVTIGLFLHSDIFTMSWITFMLLQGFDPYDTSYFCNTTNLVAIFGSMVTNSQNGSDIWALGPPIFVFL